MNIIDRINLPEIRSYPAKPYFEEEVCMESRVRQLEKNRDDLIECILTMLITVVPASSEQKVFVDAIEVIESVSEKTWVEIKKMSEES